MNPTVEIMDTTQICRNFPDEPPQEILRESFIDTINQLFEKHSIVLVEGREGIGKTTLLAQFARQFAGSAISIFITPATQSSYDPDSIRTNLLEQASWLLNQKSIDDKELEGLDIKVDWGFKQSGLQRRAKNLRKKYYFIVDGLGEIPDQHSNFRDLILDLLPLGRGEEFRFLVSGSAEKFSKRTLELVTNKSFQMSSFTLSEVYQNLADMDFTKEEINELYKTFKYPGQFATIRRLMQSGLHKNDFFESNFAKASQLLEFEWQHLNYEEGALDEVLAILAFSSLEISPNDVAAITRIDKHMVDKFLDEIPFVIRSDTGYVRFVSDAHQKHAQKKLYKYKEVTEEKLIEYLKNLDGSENAVYLPAVYNQSGRFGELVNYLTPETFSKILKSKQSLIPLREAAKLGVEAALSLHKDGDLVRLGLQSSIIDNLYSSDIWESEINALIAIKDIQSALALTERATTKEDRLYLLSVLASAKEKYKLDVQGLEERIKNAYQQVDHKKLGEKAIDIAANLINIDSMRDLAFSLVEKNTDDSDGENALDLAFAKLSLKAINENDDRDHTIDVVEKIQNRIKSPKAQNFLNRSLFYLNFSGERIIAEAKKMERASEQLYLLRSWVMKNREALDAADVVEFGLSIAITTTDYAPNARDFRELSVALPFINNIEKRKRLVSIINGQKGTIEKLGPIEDYVRIMLILALAEKDDETETCLDCFVDAYLYTTYLEDLSTKSSCLARISSALSKIDPDKSFEEHDLLHSTVRTELATCVSELLGKTADQYLVTKGIIRALAQTDPLNALDIAQSLNGEDRRNRAIYNLANSTLDAPDKNLNLEFVYRCIQLITNRAGKDELLLQVLSRINGAEDSNVDEQTFLKFATLAKEVQDAPERCNACCIVLQTLPRYNPLTESVFRTNIIELLTQAWDSIDVGWVKVDVGFKIVESLSEFPELIQKFFKKVDDFRNTIFLDSDDTAFAYIACVKLTIRAFSGLFAQKIETENDITRVTTAIENIPSMTERVGLFTDLALRFRAANREDKFNEIVRNKVRPSLEKIQEVDGLAKELATVASSPALYLFHPTSALATIDKLNSSRVQDNAYAEICSYIITKCYKEPYYNPGNTKGKKLTKDEIRDLISLLGKIDEDSKMFYVILEITESIDTYRNNFTKNEKAEFARELEEISRKRFPNKKFIKHDGYLIIALAQIFKIRDTKPGEWNTLIELAKNINVSDQVLILAGIADCISDYSKRRQILLDAENLITSIPSVYDQISRYELLSQSAIEFDQQLSRRYLKAGMEILVKQEDSDGQSVLRRYVDLAYKINPEFAASLASLADNDPARERAKQSIHRRLSQLKLKDEISEAGSTDPNSDELDDRDYPSAAWTLLGSLNAKRVNANKFEAIRDYAKVASNLPLSQAFPIYSWLIQNGIVKYANTSNAGDHLRPVFEATLAGCNLIVSISQKSNEQIKIAKSSIKEANKSSVVIVDMESDDAKAILTNWIRTHVDNELYIADGYFGMEDLWVLQVVKDVNSDCKVYILTSKAHNEKLISPGDQYPEYWRLNISDQETPPTEVVIVSATSSGSSPIHDRWWISGKAGIAMGTSINGLGGGRISEIRDLSIEEAEEREEIIKRFVINKIREYKGNKIRYLAFTMP
jgi:hypothetical protein